MLSFIVGHVIHSSFRCRYDGNPKLRYQTAEEAGCKSEPFSFYSGEHLLRGEKLYIGDTASCKKALIFFHGAGAGHTAYTLEMSYFAKKGYLVYGYDNTGCMWSEGKEVGDLAKSIEDVHAFFEFLKDDKDYHGQPLFALGHSWGGVGVLHCLHPEIPVCKCVALAGACSLVDIYSSINGGVPNWMRKPIAAYLKRKYGKAAVDDIKLFEKTEKPFLYIYGDKDELILNAKLDQTMLGYSKSNPAVSIQCVKNMGHNCYWTKKTEEYIQNLMGKKNYGSLECDPSVRFFPDNIEDEPAIMNSIFDFFER